MGLQLRPRLVVFAAVAALTPAFARAADSAPAPLPKPAEILVYPLDVDLTTARDRQSLIVQARYSDGI
ncbi:MAG TPA: hypothetical protein VG056_08445, partial [Pirellulales bacterium]|nr:hypothetical protein [Pirellulales bacterium]